jgi:hypothetical protein
MRKGNLTREQAITKVGLAAVEMVEGKNCDFTGRIQCDGDNSIEFAASVNTTSNDGDCVLTVYYYQSKESLDLSGGDLGNCEWSIYGYEVI